VHVQVDLAGDVDFVLDRDRHAEQRPFVAGAPPRLRLLGFEHRLGVEDLAEGVQLGVEPIDPLERLPHELRGTDLPFADHLRLPRHPRERNVISPRHRGRILSAGRPTSQCALPDAPRVTEPDVFLTREEIFCHKSANFRGREPNARYGRG
jgi:hypothetical protein